MTGAIPALRGFRTQFLYSIYRILLDYDRGYNFHIEGKFEDLDIVDEGGNYIEVIQIKNQAGKLNFSDLFSKHTSLFKRSEKLISSNEEAKIRLVSFGNVSDELKNSKSLSKKLIAKQFKKTNVDSIIQNFSVEIHDEKTLTSKVLEKLKDLSLFSDPNIALELLMYWIYKSAENNEHIQAKQLISNLERIGNFINQQNNFNTSFFNTIIPLSTKSLESEDLNSHLQNFYYGVSARYEHILADLDVIREDKLLSIYNAFKKNEIVFVYGASGQGKSTLAYRYLKEFIPERATYELKISQSLDEVYKVISSLEALSKGLNFPITIYIDVPPQNTNWNEIIKQLNGKKNLKFLITIRQEDWNKTPNLNQFYNFKEIELFFDRTEAEFIYRNLSKVKNDLQFTDFDESWKVFGEEGLLLEYVYLINQGNSLKSRLSEQVNNLRSIVTEKDTDELEILKFVALSDSFNSRINYKKLVKKLNIKEPIKYIQDLQKEYLIQHSENGEYLIGLHPIRSKILTEILFEDDIYNDIFEYISNSLKLIDEEDLLNFLLFSFSKGYSLNTLIKELEVASFKSWTGYLNTFNALLWKGIYEYMMKSNLDTFNEAYQLYGKAWYLLLDFILTKDKLLDSDFLLKNKTEEFLQKNNELKNQLTNKQEIYVYCKSWLNKLQNINITPINTSDWKSFGEFVYWSSTLKINLPINIKDDSFVAFFKEYPDAVEEQAVVLLGLKTANYKIKLIELLESHFVDNLRMKLNVIYFNKKKNEIDSYYIYDITSKNPNRGKSTSELNALSMTLIDLMRKGFPEINIYKTRCYGHNMLGVELDYDDSIKNISRDNLYIDFFIHLNVIFRNIFTYSTRPNSWKEYVSIIQENRKLNLSALKIFKTGLIKYFKNNSEGSDYLAANLIKIEKEIKEIKECELPKLISDRWGYYGDDIFNNENKDNVISSSSEKYYDFKKYKDDYFSAISTFINVTGFKEIINTFHRLNGNEHKIENQNNKNITEINLYEAIVNLIKFQKEFERLFLKYVDKVEEEKLKNEEIDTLISLFNVWKIFLHSNQRTLKVSSLSTLTFKKTKIDFQLNLLKNVKSIFKKTGFFPKIETDETNKILYFYLNVDFENYNQALTLSLSVIIDAFGNVHHTSLKRLLIELNFKKIVIVHLYNGNPVNRNFIILETSRISSIKNIIENDEADNFWKLFTTPQEDDFRIFDNLDLTLWNKIVPELSSYETLAANLQSLKYYIFHLRHICDNISHLDSLGKRIFDDYTSKLSSHIQLDIIAPANLALKQINDFIENKNNENLRQEIYEYSNCLEKLNMGFVNKKKFLLDDEFKKIVYQINPLDDINKLNKLFIES